MTNTEIFTKVIEKAKNNGYNPTFGASYSYTDSYAGEMLIYKEYIFGHDFAKAFWGKDEVDERGRTLIKAWEEEYRDSGLFMDFDEFVGEPEIYYEEEWIYHLTKMVIVKEPLKYLEKFL